MNYKILIIVLTLLIYNPANIFSKNSEIVPQAKNWLEIDLTTEENSNPNGFYYLVGFNCTKNESPFEFGKSLVDEQNSRIITVDKQINNNIATPIYDSYYYQDNPSFSIINELLYSTKQEYTLDYYVEKRELILELKNDLDYFVKRYEQIDDYNYFSNTVKPHQDLELLSFHGILQIKQLNLALIALQLKTDQQTEALEEIKKEIDKSRFLLSNIKCASGKILSLMMLESDLMFLTKLVNDSDMNLEKVREIVPNYLTSEEKNWDEIFIRNFQEGCNYVKSLLNNPARSKKTIKSHKIFVNNLFDYYNYIIDMSSLDAPAFKINSENLPNFEPSKWKKLTNPIQDIILLDDFALNMDLSYIAKQFYIEGYINLLKLNILIKLNQIKPDQITQFVSTHSDSLNNPFTLSPIVFDQDKSILLFDGPLMEGYDNLNNIKVKF